jgi:hypothetical protein
VSIPTAEPISANRRTSSDRGCSASAAAGLSDTAFRAPLALCIAAAFALTSGRSPSTPLAGNGPLFTDVASSAGLTHRTVFGGRDTNTYILETTGTGVAFLDFDRDGILDVFFANGRTLAEPDSGGRTYLYRGKGDGGFLDVTDKAGVARRGWGQGVAAGDYDNDGYPDLYLTFYGTNVLFHNNGNGTFSDVTAPSGTAAGGWSTSAGWADFDSDGFLDLYVARYIEFDAATAPRPGARVPGVNCSYRGFPVMCGPRGLQGVRDILFRNNGDGTFRDITESAGIDPSRFRGLGVVWGDFNNDRRPDVLVANDAQPNLLYVNRGDRTFEDVALSAGVAVDEDGRERAGMGIDFADYDNDGWLDIAIGNFYGEPCSVYRNLRDGTFAETTWSSGVGRPTVPVLTWGTRFFDFDNDGWKDLLFVNGHVYPEVEAHGLDETYAQRAMLFRNNANGTFSEAGSDGGGVWAKRWAARGAAVGDYDNDGRLDAVIAVVNDTPVLLRNGGSASNHWLSIQLVGTSSNRDAIGARVTVSAAGRTITEEIRASGSYLSQSDLRAHVGLGSATRADRIDVLWPSGRTESVGAVDANTFLTIREGSGIASRRRAR